MKQFYYGNDHAAGYSTLAVSPGVPRTLEASMVKWASNAQNAGDFSGLFFENGYAVLMKSQSVQPRIELRESRPTFFSHQLIAEGAEAAAIAKNIPDLIGNIPYNIGYKPYYDTSDIRLSLSRRRCRELPEEVRKAVKAVVEKKGFMIIIGSSLPDESVVRDLYNTISPAERMGVGYLHSASVSRLTLDDLKQFRFIFCTNSSSEILQQALYGDCYGDNIVFYEPQSGNIRYANEYYMFPERRKKEENIGMNNGYNENMQMDPNQQANMLRGGIEPAGNKKSPILPAVIASVIASIITSTLVTFAMIKVGGTIMAPQPQNTAAPAATKAPAKPKDPRTPAETQPPATEAPTPTPDNGSGAGNPAEQPDDQPKSNGDVTGQ